MAYTFDDIKGTVTMLAAHYSDLIAIETSVGGGEPTIATNVLKILGALRQPLNEDDRNRFDQVLDKVVETKLHAHFNSDNQ